MHEQCCLDAADLFSRFRDRVEETFGGALTVRLVTEEPVAGRHTCSIMLTGELTAKPQPPAGAPAAGDEESARGNSGTKTIVGKHIDLQGFFRKDEPPYSEEFMLDLEFNPGNRTCTIHNINLPYFLRERGAGSKIIREIEKLCRSLGMQYVYVPSEHDATNFWLKQGYRFTFGHEQSFFLKNRQRKNIFIAYDLRKDLNTPAGNKCRRN